MKVLTELWVIFLSTTRKKAMRNVVTSPSPASRYPLDLRSDSIALRTLSR